MLARALLQITSGIDSPLDISGCVLWLDASDTASISGNTDGANVTQWDDKSASGFDVTPISTSPVYKTSIQNGKNIVRFAGAGLINASATLLRSTGGFSTFVVGKSTGTGGYTGFVFVKGASDGRMSVNTAITTAYLYGQARRANADADAYTPASPTAGVTSMTVISFVGDYDSTTATVYTNGSVYATDGAWLTSGTTPNDGGALYVGAFASGGAMTGDVGEIVIYNNALGSANRQLVEQYLRTKWGI